MKIPLIYNIRSVLHRPAASLATALGVAFVVLTFVGMLALANGFRGDAETVMGVFRGPVYQSMTVRLADANAFAALKSRIENEPRLQMQVKRESEFFAEQSNFLGNVLRFIAFFVTIIMAVGAVFGAVNTMDAMVAMRGREIALLQTLGFRPLSVMTSFLIEAVFLALIGGVLGCLLALPINGIQTSTTNWQSFGELTFAFRVTPEILAQGLVFAAVMGFFGGLLPARRAARQVVALGLRRE